MKRSQGGAAVLVVLVVLTLCASLLASYGYREYQRLDRLGSAKLTDRMLLLGLSVENWVRGILLEDAQNSSIDSLDEDWAQVVPALPIEGGMLFGQVTDLNRFVDINRFTALVPSDFEQEEREVASSLRLITRLAELAGTELPDIALHSLVDWQDSDDLRTKNGFEYAEYQLKLDPYRSSNGPLVDPSELFLIEGFTEEIIEKLKPHITAGIPSPQGINVNTASEVVLMALWDRIDHRTAEQLILVRSQVPWSSTGAFFQSLADELGEDVKDIRAVLDRPGYSPVVVKSNRFRLQLSLNLEGMQMNYAVDFQRETHDSKVSTRVESRNFSFSFLEDN